ncbi:MAG: hypothetical protein ACREKI_02680 [Gemmatimonadota bacterium]
MIRRQGVRIAISLLVLAATATCVDRDLASTDPSNPPGEGAATVEVRLDVADLGTSDGFDTTLVGFAHPPSVGRLVVADSGGFRSRTLLRFSTLGLQVFIGDTLHDPVEFSNGRFIVRLDSALSSVPSGAILSLYDAEQIFDARSATWTFAVDTPGVSTSWSVPGGVLGAPIASDTFAANAETDTVVVQGDTLVGALVLQLGAATDSLVHAWRDTLNPHPGLVLALEAATDLYLEVAIPALAMDVRYDLSADTTLPPDTILPSSHVPDVRTFIFDPPVPDPGTSLAVAGLPAARSYVEVRLPESLLVDGTLRPLLGSAINRAELWLTSRPLPAPLRSRRSIPVRTFVVTDDVRTFGPKTPLGAEIVEGRASVVPDSLPDGERFVVGLTSIVRLWASTPPDSTPLPIRFVIRADPEAIGLGNWTFAGSGQPGGPVLRIVFTPPTDFELP